MIGDMTCWPWVHVTEIAGSPTPLACSQCTGCRLVAWWSCLLLHDLGHRDLGHHDLGYHDLGHHNLSHHDLGHHDDILVTMIADRSPTHCAVLTLGPKPHWAVLTLDPKPHWAVLTLDPKHRHLQVHLDCAPKCPQTLAKPSTVVKPGLKPVVNPGLQPVVKP